MSMFIHAIIVILLAVLAMGIGLLILVCWALAACAADGILIWKRIIG